MDQPCRSGVCITVAPAYHGSRGKQTLESDALLHGRNWRDNNVAKATTTGIEPRETGHRRDPATGVWSEAQQLFADELVVQGAFGISVHIAADFAVGPSAALTTRHR